MQSNEQAPGKSIIPVPEEFLRRKNESPSAILEKERARLIPIAARENLVALVIIFLVGVVLLTTFALSALGYCSHIALGFVSCCGAIMAYVGRVCIAREEIISLRIQMIVQALHNDAMAQKMVDEMDKTLKNTPEDKRSKAAEDILADIHQLRTGFGCNRQCGERICKSDSGLGSSSKFVSREADQMLVHASWIRRLMARIFVL